MVPDQGPIRERIQQDPRVVDVVDVRKATRRVDEIGASRYVIELVLRVEWRGRLRVRHLVTMGCR